MRPTLWARYLVERWMLRGSPAMLAMLVAVLCGIAVCGAFVAYSLPGEHFPTFGEALWWSVLRISDPGYLSDDIPDIGVRILSVTLSVLGMAVTVGGIVAIVSQTLNSLLASLAAATTPVPFSDHIVLLGWTDRTPRLLSELLKIRGMKIVILVEHVGTHEMHLVARSVPTRTATHRVVLRRGIPTRARDLERAACQSARAIILAASEQAVAGDPAAGAHALKSLLALRSHLGEADGPQPLVVMEVVDRALIPLAEATLPEVRVLHSDRVMSRVLRLGLQGAGLLSLADRIVRPHSSWQLTTRPAEDFIGKSLVELDEAIKNGRLLGAVVPRPGEKPAFVPDAQYTPSAQDELLVMEGPEPSLPGQEAPPESSLEMLKAPPLLRILVLGWSEVVPDLIAELSMEPEGRYEVDIVSEISAKRRKRTLEGIRGAHRVQIHHFVTKSPRLDSVEGLDLSKYDRFLVPSDRSGAPGTADARTLAFVLDLNQSKAELKRHAYVTIELLEAEDLSLFPYVESIVTPELIADVLISSALAPESHQALRKKLRMQQTYVTRVLPLPAKVEVGLAQLRAALRSHGAALLDVVPGSSRRKDAPQRVLAVIPAVTDAGSRPPGLPQQSPKP